MIVPVFKTGGRHLRCCRCVRLTHASATFQQLTDNEITRKSVHWRERDANDLRVGLLHLIRDDITGNSLLRFLLVEAAQVTVRSDQEWRSKYFHLAMRRGRKIAKVAMARRLAVRMYWMWRKRWDYEQLKKFGSHAGQPGHRQGVQ